MIRLLMVAFLGLSTLSCGKGGIANPFGSDDPYIGQPDYIQEAARTGGGGIIRKPGSDRLQYDEIILSSNVSYFSFRETTPGEGQLNVRILRPGYTASLAIENINDFPGATFDSSTGIFRWTPPLGRIPVGQDQVEMSVKVEVSVAGTDGRITKVTKPFLAYLRKASIQAAIVGNTLPTQFLREGTETLFNVTVQYRGVNNQSSPPDLTTLIERPANSFDRDLSGFVKQVGNPRQNGANSNQWYYTFSIDLRNVDLTKTSQDHKFQLAFQNPESVKSLPQEFNVQVRTDLQALRTTLERAPIRVKVGTTLTRDAVFYDPREEGYVFAELQNPTVLPQGMTVEACREGDTSNSMRICTVTWTVSPQQSTATTVDLKFKVESRSQAVGDNLTLSQNFTMTFQAVP